MKRLFLMAISLAVTLGLFPAAADVMSRGTVIDEQGEPLVGVTVQAVGTNVATASDIDGKFALNVPTGSNKLKLSYVGYKTLEQGVKANMGQLRMEPDSHLLQDVVVTQSLARTRMTPVAISEVDAGMIESKLGNQEFPEVLKTTPGVWATPDGGGYGDAKINMRGFKSENVAVLLNGIPMNDMEWGGIYWSNFSGLSEVTSSMQTQRGLGAAIISAPSIGGTINITTRGLDAKKGGSMWYGMGNDGLNNIGLMVSTGLMKNGWAMTFLGSRKWGDGYVQGTNFNAFNYFVNISKRINDSNQISFTAFGAPQSHYQRSSNDGLTIDGWQDVRNYMDGESPYRYNPTYGFDRNGQRRTSSHNQYHKPIIALNHIWQINEKSSLSSALYLSLSSGGGYSGQGRTATWGDIKVGRSLWYGASYGVLNTTLRNPDGTFAYGMIQEMNEQSTTGSYMVMSESNNSHEWYGLVSTYKNEFFNNKLIFTGGVDFRYYVGHHNNKIIDLYDGQYYMDYESRASVKAENNAAALNPAWQYEKLGVGDVVYRDYNGHTHQEGAYAQGEYKALDNKLTAILAGSINNTGYQRLDFFYYDEAHRKSESLNFIGGTVKGGANYNINRYNNVFANVGFISRAPFFRYGAFLSPDVSNATNPNAINEKIFSVEAGYGFHSPQFSATVNAYFTKWYDKTTTRGGEMTQSPTPGERYALNMSGVNSRHMGIELNFKYIPLQWLEFDGMLSLGDWVWDSNAKGYFYNSLGQPLADINTGALASGIFAADHAWAMVNQKGVKVGGSAQTTGFLGVTFKPFKGFKIGVDWLAAGNNYSDFSISSSAYAANKAIDVTDRWKIPMGQQFDLNASYRFKIGGLNATVYGNVYNLFNYYYVKDAYTDSDKAPVWQNAYRVFYAFGRTYSLRLKVNF